MFAISNTGSLTMKENVWHNDLAGYNRFYFGNNSTTYISGHGTDSCVEFIVVVVPSTCRFPAMTTVPVLSPTVAGSIVNEAV